MNELIKINYENENPTVSGRDLHEFLEIETQYTIWFPRMTEYGFKENQDFNLIFFDEVRLEGDREVTRRITDHALTIDMAKEICMIQRNDKGKEARQYFIEVEKKYTQLAYNLPTDYLSALKALVVSEETKIQLIEQNKKQEEQIAILAPKGEFFDAVASSKSAIDMAQSAKVLDMGIGRNELFAFLRNNGVLMGDNIPYQTYIDRGYFRTIEQKYTKPDGSTNINIKTLVYQRGLDYIRKLYTKETGGYQIVKAN